MTSNDETGPDWLSERSRRHYADGMVRPVRGGPVEIIADPDDGEVAVALPRGGTTRIASAVDTRAVLHVGEQTCQVHIPPTLTAVTVSFPDDRNREIDVHLAGDCEITVVNLGTVNVHGSPETEPSLALVLAVHNGSRRHPQVGVRARSQAVHVNSVTGTGHVAIDGGTLDADAEINVDGHFLRGMKNAARPFEARSATVAGTFEAARLEQVADVTAGAVGLTGDGNGPTVPAGSTLTATTGPVDVKGSVDGTSHEPVLLRAATEVKLITADHAMVEPSQADAELELVSISESTRHVTVRGAKRVTLGNAGEHTHLTAREVGLVDSRRAPQTHPDLVCRSATLATVHGPGTIAASTVRLHDVTAPEDGERLQVTVGNWFRSGPNVAAHITAHPEAESDIDVVHVVLDSATKGAGRMDAPTASQMGIGEPPDGEPAPVAAEQGRAELRLTGPLTARVRSQTADIHLESGVQDLLLHGEVALAATDASGKVHVDRVRALKDLTVDASLKVAGSLVAPVIQRRGGGSTASVEAAYVVCSSIDGVAVSADELEAVGDITDAKLDISERTVIEGHVSAPESDNTLEAELGGRVTIASNSLPLVLGAATDVTLGTREDRREDPASTTPSIEWRPTDAEASLEVHSPVGQLRVRPGNNPCLVLLTGKHAKVERTTVGGHVQLTATGGGSPGEVVLTCGAHLSATGVSDLPLRGVSDDPERPSVIALDEGDHTITLRCQEGHLEVDAQGGDAEMAPSEMKEIAYTITRDESTMENLAYTLDPSEVAVTTWGGVVTVDTEIRRMTFNEPRPTLSITADGAVLGADGFLTLASLQGQLTGVPADWWRGARLHKRVLLESQQGRHSESEVTRLTVDRVAPPDGTKSSAAFSGVLTQVDVSKLTSADFGHLGHLHQFEPDPVPLEREARRMDGDRVLKQRRATALFDVANLTSEHATGGTIKTRARWAALHAQAATATGSIERVLRRLSGRLGYRQRPGPPAIVFGLIALLWLFPLLTNAVTDDAWPWPRWTPSAIETEWCEGYLADHDLIRDDDASPTMVEEIDGYDGYQHLGRVVFAPASPLKAFTGSSIGLAPLGCGSPPGLILSGLLSVTLIYTGIGLVKMAAPRRSAPARRRAD